MILRVFLKILNHFKYFYDKSLGDFALLHQEIKGHFRFCFTLLGWVPLLLFSGCLPLNNLSVTSKNLTPTTITVTEKLPLGPRAAKIVFKTVDQQGSFASPPASGGTLNASGSGVQATTIFNPDGSSLATSNTSTSWPSWLSSVELGISGSSNTKATEPDCARFSEVSSDGNAQCNFKNDSGATLVNCGAPSGYYRVSDYDCQKASVSTERGIGSGIESDGVYIRATFNRDHSALGANENILAVLEYSASALNPAPANPTQCFSGGATDIQSCADLTWQLFTKHSATEPALQPFLLLVPPAFAFIHSNLGSNTGLSGSGVTTKQFIIPLASDADLKVLQISRTGISSSLVTDSDSLFTKICNPDGGSSNSALCVGMVFYSLTFYRI